MSNVSPFSVEANGSKAGSPSKPNREKGLIAGIIVLAIVLVGLIIAVIVLAINASKQPSGDVCTTAPCLETALDLKLSMNESVDPCEDFYKFACGRWSSFHLDRHQNNLAAITLDGAFKIHGVLTAAQNIEGLPSSVLKIANAYVKCGVYSEMSEEDEEWLAKALKRIGGWPMIDEDWQEGTYHWERNLAVAIHDFVASTIIQIDVGENVYDTSKRVIQVSQPGIETMPKLEKERILNVVKALGGNRDGKEVEEEFEDVVKFQEELKEFSRPIMELIQDRTQLKEMTFKKLKDDFNLINWQEFLRTAFGSLIREPIRDTEIMLVAGVDYLSKVLPLLFEQSISKRTLANYIAVSIVQGLLESNAAIGQTIPELSPTDALGKLFKGITVPRGFTFNCYTFFSTKASPAVDFLNYRSRIAATVDPKMLTYFSSAMSDQINDASWLGTTTRDRALEKLHEMKYFIAFPERDKDPKKVEKYFEGLPELTSNVLQNQVLIERHHFKKKVELLRVPTDRNKWPMADNVHATQTNAMYVQDYNAVAMPADVQLKPIFAADRPRYWNFGLFGWIIGHEITHGFDTSGSKRDKYGNIKDWWTPEAKRKFNERAKCMIEQYNKIPYGFENHYVNGTQTVGENVADNGGMRQAYAAYKKWQKDHEEEKRLPGFEKYNIEQIFFISMAQGYCSHTMAPKDAYEKYQHDEHSPTHMRFNPAASNFDAFAKAFNCKKGSPMNPVKKCVVW